MATKNKTLWCKISDSKSCTELIILMEHSAVFYEADENWQLSLLDLSKPVYSAAAMRFKKLI